MKRARDVHRPRVRRTAAGVGNDGLPSRACVPRFHCSAFVGLGEVGEEKVASVDVGEVAGDDLLLVPGRSSAEVPAHGIDGDVTRLSEKLGGIASILVGVGRAGQVDAETPSFPCGVWGQHADRLVTHLPFGTYRICLARDFVAPTHDNWSMAADVEPTRAET